MAIGQYIRLNTHRQHVAQLSWLLRQNGQAAEAPKPRSKTAEQMEILDTKSRWFGHIGMDRAVLKKEKLSGGE